MANVGNKSASSGQSTWISPNTLLPGSSDWLQRSAQAPLKFYIEALQFTARSLQDQADYVRKLSECSDPATAMKCHGEFMQQAWARSVKEGSKLFGTLQSSSPSSSE